MRLKISFMALQKNMTVYELIFNGILKSYKETKGPIRLNQPSFEQVDQIYSHMLDGDQGTLRRYIEKQFEQSSELQTNSVVGNNIQKQKTLNDKKEVFNVRKNGITQKVKIYPEKNNAKQNEIKKILQKN